MNIDLTFAQNYTIDRDAWLPSTPGSVPVYYYPGASQTAGQDGILLEILPDAGATWLGMFAGGTQGYISGAYGCPNGHSICVVSSGRCYFVRADDPQQWREKNEIVWDAKVLPEQRMLILCANSALIAYGAHGFLWETESIGVHGLIIEAIDGNVLHGKTPTHHKQSDGWLEFEIDLVTGKHKGGRT